MRCKSTSQIGKYLPKTRISIGVWPDALQQAALHLPLPRLCPANIDCPKSHWDISFLFSGLFLVPDSQFPRLRGTGIAVITRVPRKAPAPTTETPGPHFMPTLRETYGRQRFFCAGHRSSHVQATPRSASTFHGRWWCGPDGIYWSPVQSNVGNRATFRGFRSVRCWREADPGTPPCCQRRVPPEGRDP